jgi:hypothetical protein
MIARTILRFRKNTKASVAAKNQKQNTFAILAGVKACATHDEQHRYGRADEDPVNKP